jgi:hypothetical protein
MELILSTAPGGHVPGAGGDGYRLRPMVIDDKGGPDGVLYFLSRVSTKSKDLAQIAFFSKVLFVNCSLPLMNKCSI